MRLFVLLIAAVLQSACNTGQTVSFKKLQPEVIRPGLTAAQIGRVAPVPNGLRKVWQYRGGQAFDTFRPQLDVRLRTAGNGVAWRGNFKFRIPGANVREIARQIEAVTGRKAPIEGNFALLPVAMSSDRKGRITSFQFLREKVTYAPHDCQNVVGKCKSLWRDGNGQTRHVIVETREEGGRWFATVRLDPARNLGSARAIEQRVYSVDRYGIYKDASIIDLEDGEAPIFMRSLQ
ncbi:MAG: hypothetical protein AAF393_00975 [Pseudomonadota bacterium]